MPGELDESMQVEHTSEFKLDQADISPEHIRRILKEFEESLA